MTFKFTIDGQRHELSRLMLGEARAIQKVTGKTLGEWERALGDGDVECLAALVWVARKRELPTLAFDQVDFDVMSFDLRDDDEPADVEEPGKDESAPTETLAGL